MRDSATDTRRFAALPAVMLALVLVPVAAEAQAQERRVTFARDVAPIMQNKCQACHRPGSMAPMSFLTYEEVRPWARSIKARVSAREMPPWFIDKQVGIQRFKNDASLSDEQIDTIVRWVDAGAPLGDASELPAPITWPEGSDWRLAQDFGKPDVIVRSVPFTMPAHGQDQWWRPVVDVGLQEDRSIRAYEVKPTVRKITHHAGTFLYQPEDAAVAEARNALLSGNGSVEAVRAAQQRPSGKPVMPTEQGGEVFVEWAIGKPGEIYADGTGRLLKPGAKIGFEIHYHAVGEELTDTVEVGLWFYPKGYSPKHAVEFVSFGAGGPTVIPPEKVAMFQGYTVLRAPAIIQSFQPHMHMRGKASIMEAILPDGKTQILSYVPNFDNNWHINYIYADDAAPVLPKGTIIHSLMWFDNTVANRNNPDPRQWVTGGDRTVDEMASNHTTLVYLTQAEYEQIIQARKKAAGTAQQ